MKALLDRVMREPVLIVAVVLAVANLFGSDLSALAGFIETAVVLVSGVVARHFVTPVHDPRLD